MLAVVEVVGSQVEEAEVAGSQTDPSGIAASAACC